MTVVIAAFIVISLAAVGVVRLSAGRDRRCADYLAKINAFLDANPRLRPAAGSNSAAAARDAKVYFLDVYRDRAARLARHEQAMSQSRAMNARTAQQHRPA